MISTLERYVSENLRQLKRVRIDTLLKRRYERLRNLGSFLEGESVPKSTARSKAGGNGQASRSNGNTRRANGTNGRNSGGRGVTRKANASTTA
jgi:hypothetical protein